MPKFKVTIDGKSYAVTVPEGQGPQQAYAYARRAQGAGPAQTPTKSAARQLWDNTVNDVAGIAQGRASMVDMLAQGTGKIMSLSAKPYEMAADALGLVETANVIRSARGAVANPPTIGGLIESVAPTPQTTSGKAQRMLGQLVGGAMTGPETNLLLKGTGMAPSVPKGFKAPAKPGKLIDSASEVVDAGKQAGVRVMTSDVRPPKTFIGKLTRGTGERIPFAGTAGSRAKQQVERVESVKNLLRDYGGDDVASLFDDGPTAVNEMASDLIARRGAQLSRLKAAKDSVIDKFATPVATPNAIRAIDEQVGRLKGINDQAFSPVIKKLEEFKQVISTGKTLNQIEGNRKILGDMFQDQSLAALKSDGQKAINAIYAPLREDMAAFIKVNGQKGDLGRWKNANDQLAAMAGELKSGAFKSVLNDAETTPENAAKLLFSSKPSDVQRLYANLTPVGQGKARTAILQRAFDKAVSANGGLSVEVFLNNLDRLGSPLGVAFKGADRVRVEGLARVLNATRRASEAAALPPTGVQNTPIAAGYTLGSLAGWAAVPVAAGGGLVARAYESPAVRNLLVALGQAKPGSAAETALLNRASQAISKVVAANSTRSTAPATALNDNLMQIGSVAASPDQRPDQPNQ